MAFSSSLSSLPGEKTSANPDNNPRGFLAPEYDTPFNSTWQSPLPDDEIARQQDMKERLSPGCEVTVSFDNVVLGRFRYAGIWDTMHSFYPLSNRSLADSLPDRGRRYLRRDLRGRHYLLIPYTLLADCISF